MKPYAPYLKILKKLEASAGDEFFSKHQLLCKSGDWMDCAVLKLQKSSWTQGGMGEGVFFGVWIGEKDLKKSRANYNIHAYKLRLWKGHAIKPREFAARFRSRLKTQFWPNVRTDYGPQNLMQGWIGLDRATLEEDVLKLMREFASLTALIDVLIEEGKSSPAK